MELNSAVLSWLLDGCSTHAEPFPAASTPHPRVAKGTLEEFEDLSPDLSSAA